MLRLLLFAALAVAAASPAAAQTACVDGMAGEYPCQAVALMSNVSPQTLGSGLPGQCGSSFPNTCAKDIWGWTDPETGSEYAIVGLSNGTAFVDVTVATAPRPLGMMPTATSVSSWRDVKAIGDVAVVVSEAGGHGIQIFDLTRLRGLSADAGRRQFDADARYTGVGSAHNVVVNEDTGFVYAVGARNGQAGLPATCNARGLHAVDLSDPMQPAFAGCFSDVERESDPYVGRGYTHDAQCLIYQGPDADYQSRELCFASNEDVVTVFDVTDKADVQIVSQVEYPGDVYTHQGWLTEDQRYFLANDELDEVTGSQSTQRTIVMDLEDLDDPGDVTIYDSGITSIDHNLYVRGRYAYESNYEAGLRILDLQEIGTQGVREIAYFDTYPSRTAINEPCLPPNQTQNCDGFNGQWSNYPFFASGNVIASDAQRGLFVLRPDPSLVVANEAAPAALPYALSAPFPNPAQDGARLTLQVDDAQHVTAELFDVAGRRVAQVFDGAVGLGQTVALEVRRGDLPAGVYLVRVAGERFQASRRLVLTR